MMYKISFFIFLSVFTTQLFSQGDTVLTKAQRSEIKQLSSGLKGQWWMLNKTCGGSPIVIQQTRLNAKGTDDTARPLLRIEFRKKGVALIHDYPAGKAANGKTGTWKIRCKKSVHSSIPDTYFLILSDEIKLFLGISFEEGAVFYWKNKHLILADDKKCLFEFRSD